MEIRELCIDECDMIRHIDRSEKVRAAWMKTKDSDRCLDFIYLDIEGYGDDITDCVRILKKVIADQGYVVGAFDRGTIIGITSVLPNLDYEQNCSQLVSLDVSCSYRRCGVGRKLLHKCIEKSSDRNCSRMIVASNPHEYTQKFLRSVGFTYNTATNIEYYSLGFPSFRFPEPFGNGVEEYIDLELDITAFNGRDYFADRVTISDISRLNYYAVARLEITDEQSFTFGNNPVYWLASRDYEFGDDYRMLSIDFDGFPVGFMGYGVNNDRIYIEPMMVDSMFQRKGIASKALELFEEKIRTETQYRIVTIGNRTDNTAADKTYEKAGYVLLKTDGLSRYREKLL